MNTPHCVVRLGMVFSALFALAYTPTQAAERGISIACIGFRIRACNRP